MAAVSPAPRFTLRDAESKLLTYEEDDASKDVNLRRAFMQPPHMVAEDVYVQRELCMKRGKGHREALGVDLANHCVRHLSARYNCYSAEEAKLLLKIYVCEVSAGNREDRIYATEVGNGLVKLTLAWCLTLKDGSVVLDGGRLHAHDHHMFGLGDFLGLAAAEKTLQKMANGMCDRILKQTDIPSRYNMCGCITSA